MVTEDERDYMHFAYSNDPRMRINGGIVVVSPPWSTTTEAASSC